MCGISGYLGKSEADGLRFITRANSIMAHRGPNDQGIFQGRGIVLGHRRLSIVDLSDAGHQPMTSPDGRWTLIYNGEVYNHEELRAQLANRWQFRSRCDTETVLAALALDGPAALEGMVGMWSILLWDATRRRLFLSRDRYGQKPLYWRLAAAGHLQFASEIAPLLKEGEKPKMYAPAAAEFLALGNYGHLGNRTFFQDIYAFPPAHWAWVEDGAREIIPHRYWRFPALPDREKRPFDDIAKRQFRDAFTKAVESQLMADVPIAATLSGGLDSSAVVGVMAAMSKRSIKVFTAQAGGSSLDETRYVRAVIDKWKGRVDLESLSIERMRLSLLSEDVLRTQEEPFGDPSIIAHSQIMSAVHSSNIPVILGGQGGDELLLGYPYMSRAVIASEFRRGKIGWALGELCKLGQGSRTALRILLSTVSPSSEIYVRMKARKNAYYWLTPKARLATADANSELASVGNLSQFWLESIEKLALPHLVHYDDRNGMRLSIEGRMPFLDHRLADVVTSIDAKAFLSGGQRKGLLREALSDLIPSAVLARQDKIGFHTPLAQLLCDESDWVRETVCGETARELNLYDPAWAADACERLNKDPNRLGWVASLLWRCIAVVLWARVFNVDADVGYAA